MPEAHLSLQIIPMTEKERLYPIVDKVIDYIKKSGVRYIVGPMETTMEGELDLLFDIAKEAHRICLEEGAWRVGAVIKTDVLPEGIRFEDKIGKYKQV
ncbi:thiamine-binding protein [Spirochaetia bacterium 38H-sp]|uniref:Thiamine-binding protein n=1 Tax=Rarispira pelagica TaxID=3141764 RepID=A0ABU9UCB3_9SPIR